MTVDGIEQIWFLKTLKTVPCMDSVCPPPPLLGLQWPGSDQCGSFTSPACLYMILANNTGDLQCGVDMASHCSGLTTWDIAEPVDTQGWSPQELDIPV